MPHARRQGNAGNNAVECQAKRGTAPGNVVAMPRTFLSNARVVMLMVAGNFPILDIMVMKAEKPLDEEHGEQTTKHPKHYFQIAVAIIFGAQARVAGLLKRVRQHVQQADAQHHTCDKADGAFHPAVRQPKPNRDHSP